MRDLHPFSGGLEGAILVAHPGLADAGFRQTVVLIVAHSEAEGAFGLVLNRPMGQSVAEVLPLPDLGPLGGAPVFIGGPVSPQALSFVILRWREGGEGSGHGGADRLDCRLNIPAEEARDLMGDPLFGKTFTVRPFVGYAGWGRGQLEEELVQNAWFVQRPGAEILDAAACGGLWQAILRRDGPWFHLLSRLAAQETDGPSLNA